MKKHNTRVRQRGAVLAFTLFMLALLTLAGVSMVQQNKQDFLMAKNSRQQTQALASVEQLLTNAENALAQAVLVTTLGNVAVHSPCNNPSGTAPGCGNSGVEPVYGVTDPVTGITADVLATLACTPAANADGTANPPLVQTQLLSGSRLPNAAGANTLPNEATITAVACLQDESLGTQTEKMCSTYDATAVKTYCYPDNTTASKEECVVTANNPIPVAKDGTWGPYAVTGGGTTTGDVGWACYKRFKGDAASALCPYEIYTLQISFTDANGAKRSIESKYGINCGSL